MVISSLELFGNLSRDGVSLKTPIHQQPHHTRNVSTKDAITEILKIKKDVKRLHDPPQTDIVWNNDLL